MKFTKTGSIILDKMNKSAIKAYYKLKNTKDRIKRLDEKPKPTDMEIVETCWTKHKGNCAPFRYGEIKEKNCILCTEKLISNSKSSYIQNYKGKKKNYEPSNGEKAKKCWFNCYGNCAPFRSGKISEEICLSCTEYNK